MPTDRVPNNPAGRLLEICKQFRAMEDGESLRKGWAKIVSVPDADMPALLYGIGAALSVIRNAKIAIENLDDLDHNLFLSWEGPVSDAFSRLNLVNQQVHDIKTRLTPDVIKSLEFCDHELSRRAPEQTIDRNQLADLLTEVKKLADDVLKSDTPLHLKRFILDKLDMLERAIQMYQFLGIASIQQSVESIIGAICIKGKVHFEEISVSDIGQRFWDICNKAATLITLAETGIKLIGSVTTWILKS